jgi:hypothetical protein
MGMEHANLYIEMITALELSKNYCPVKFVYSVDPVKPGDIMGTTNPYFTARPFANIVMNLDPITKIDNKHIDEFLEMSNIGPVRFRDVMLDDVVGGSSVAVFWTRQGLPNLGAAIAPAFIIPAEPKPPRNAAYVFAYNGSDGFIAPLMPDQYIQ